MADQEKPLPEEVEEELAEAARQVNEAIPKGEVKKEDLAEHDANIAASLKRLQEKLDTTVEGDEAE